MTRSLRSISVVLVTLLAAATSGASQRNWSARASHEVVSIEPGTPDRYLSFLAPVLRGRSIVAMGEATHGTHEFFAAKARLFRYLVEHKGFTAIGLEAGYVECLPIDLYVHGGAGDPEALARGLQLWPWRTHEMADLMRWMRMWNADPHHVGISFYGIDSGNGIVQGFPALKAYFTIIDPAFLEQVDRAEHYVNDEKTFHNRPEGTALLDAIVSRLEDHHVDYARRTSQKRWTDARQIAAVVRQNYDYFFVKIVYEARDRHMADNAMWALRQQRGGGGLFLWAHNAHVSRDPDYYDYLGDKIDWKQIKPMGAYLGERIGDRLYVIGTEFDHGSFRAPARDAQGGLTDLPSYTVDAAAPGTLAGELAKDPRPIVFYDLHTSGAGVTPGWLTGPVAADNYGGGKVTGVRSVTPIAPGRDYDGLLFFRSTSASNLLDGAVH
jgi:erythromycin esterase